MRQTLITFKVYLAGTSNIYNIYISKHKAFIGRSRTPETSKIEIFGKEVNGGKQLIIDTAAYRLRYDKGLAVSLHLHQYFHVVSISWSLIILTAIKWPCQLPKSNCTKSFFLSYFPKKLCA